MAELLLELDVGLDLIKRYMPRTFNHNLNPGIPCTLSEFPQNDQLLDLSPVGCVGKTAGTEPVAEGEGCIVALGDFQQSVKMLVEWIFLVIVAHPLNGECTTP